MRMGWRGSIVHTPTRLITVSNETTAAFEGSSDSVTGFPLINSSMHVADSVTGFPLINSSRHVAHSIWRTDAPATSEPDADANEDGGVLGTSDDDDSELRDPPHAPRISTVVSKDAFTTSTARDTSISPVGDARVWSIGRLDNLAHADCERFDASHAFRPSKYGDVVKRVRVAGVRRIGDGGGGRGETSSSYSPFVMASSSPSDDELSCFSTTSCLNRRVQLVGCAIASSMTRLKSSPCDIIATAVVQEC